MMNDQSESSRLAWAYDAKEEAAYRKAVIKKYGNKRQAIAPTPNERAINDAVKSFVRTVKTHYERGVSVKVITLGGWSGRPTPPPERVVEAVRTALLMPTIAQAKIEYDAWLERGHELRSMFGAGPCADVLSLACELRREIVWEAFCHGIRAASWEDALVRRRYMRDFPLWSEEDFAAMSADLIIWDWTTFRTHSGT
jgi:hypothetical protein